VLHGPRPGKCLSRPIDPGQVAPLRPPSKLAFGENEGFIPKNGCTQQIDILPWTSRGVPDGGGDNPGDDDCSGRRRQAGI